MNDQTSIRWIWGVDDDGRRVTTAEAVAFTHCPNCDGLHPLCVLRVEGCSLPAPPMVGGRPVVTLYPEPGFHPATFTELATSEFFPDDDPTPC